VERRENGLKLWRIPYVDYELYPPEGIGGKAEITAGVRLRFCTDSRRVVLCFEPISQTARIDCSVNGELAEAGTAVVEAGSATVAAESPSRTWPAIAAAASGFLLTVGMIREQIEEVVDTMRSRGDRNLHYRNGLTWFGEADASMLPDGLHPDAAGCKLMGDRFAERVLAGVRRGR